MDPKQLDLPMLPKEMDDYNWVDSTVYRRFDEEHLSENVMYGRFVPDSNKNGIYVENCCIVLDPTGQFAELQRNLVKSLGDDLALQVKHVNRLEPVVEVITPEFHYDMGSLIDALSYAFDTSGKHPSQWPSFVEKRIQPVLSCIVEALRRLIPKGEYHGNIMNSIVVTDVDIEDAISLQSIKILKCCSNRGSFEADLDELLLLVLGILGRKEYPYQVRQVPYNEQTIDGFDISSTFRHFLKWLFNRRSWFHSANDARMLLYHPYVMTKKLAKNFMIEGHHFIYQEQYVPSNICGRQKLCWRQKMWHCQDFTLRDMVRQPSYNSHFLDGWRFWRNVVQHYYENACKWNYQVNLPITKVIDTMREHFHFEVMAFEILHKTLLLCPERKWKDLLIDSVFKHSLTKDA